MPTQKRRFALLRGVIVTALLATSTLGETYSTENAPSKEAWTSSDALDQDRVAELDASFGVKSTDADSWVNEPFVIGPHQPADPGADGSVAVKHHSIECAVHAWHEFTECSVSCGGGVRSRQHRTTSCPFDVYHQQCCNVQPCSDYACGAGYFVSPAATLNLEICTVEGHNWGTCNPCAAGTYKADGNDAFESSTCTDVPNYTYSGPASVEPVDWTLCPAGTFKQGATATSDGSCSPCAAGSFKTTTDLAACAPCQPGTVGSGDAKLSSYCKSCAVGTFEANAGIARNQCATCPAGRFQAAEGQSACHECTTGSCGEGFFESHPCSATADRQCNPIPSIAFHAGCTPFDEAHDAGALAPLIDLTFAAAKLTSAKVTIETADRSEVVVSGTSFLGAHLGTTADDNFIEFTGAHSTSEYQEKLRAVSFKHAGVFVAAQNGDVSQVDVAFTVCHHEHCATTTACAQVTAKNTAPTVAGVTPSIVYSSGQSDLTHVATSATLADIDNQDLVEALVTLANAKPGDSLDVTSRAEVVSEIPVCTTSSPQTLCKVAFNGTTLKLAGRGTIADYQDGIQSITFSNNADNPHTRGHDRTLSITITDASGASSAGNAIATVKVLGAEGTFSNAAETDGVATACPVGKYQPLADQSSCEECGAGTFGSPNFDATSSEHCVSCPRGTYQELKAQSVCTPCGKGMHGVSGVLERTSSAVSCSNCIPGQYASAMISTTCTVCEEGLYSEVVKSENCVQYTPCAAGEVKSWDGQTQLSTVSDGSCTKCEAGRFQSKADDIILACTNCPAGTDTKGLTGQSACTPCETSTFKEAASRAACAAVRTCDKETEWEERAPDTTSNRSCKPLTVCNKPNDPLQYESNAPDDGSVVRTADRACASVSDCVAGKFISTTHTTTSNRACTTCSVGYYTDGKNQAACKPWGQCAKCTGVITPLASTTSGHNCAGCSAGSTFAIHANEEACHTTSARCNAGFFESKAPSACNDRECTPCGDGYYSGSDATQCTKHSECGAGQGATVQGTLVADTVCEDCTGSLSYSDASSYATCTPQPMCGAGMETDAPATSQSRRTCKPCADGQYKSVYPMDRCMPWKSCPAGTEADTTSSNGPASAIRDRTCIRCVAGTSFNTLENTPCAAVTPCARGYHVSQDATPTQDNVCAVNVCTCENGIGAQGTDCATHETLSCTSCDNGFYLNAQSSTLPSCTAISTCSSNQYESVGATVTSDRVCMDLTPPCTGTQWQSKPPMASSDRVCSEWTTCTSDQWQVQAPTHTSDRNCQDVTVCNDDEYEDKEPTQTTDRKCNTHMIVCPNGQYQTAEPTAFTDRACANVHQCVAGSELESTPPTATSNRECTPVTTCHVDNQFESLAPTDTTDRVCNPLTTCDLGTYYISIPKDWNRNRVCTPLTQCDTNEYQSTAPTEHANRVCKWISTCAAGSYEKTAPSASSDRTCEACPAGHFKSATGNAASCSAWRTCGVGSGLATEGTATADRSCAACVVGVTFSTADDGSVCSSVSAPCSSGFFTAVAASAGNDLACKPNPDGAFTDSDGQNSSVVWRTCGPGTGMVTEGTATTDRMCAVCIAGSTFSPVDSGAACIALTQCKSTEWESTAPTTSSDRLCSAICPELVSLSYSPEIMPLEHCHGDCDHDGHCQLGYKCHQNHDFTPIPGCVGTPEEAMDYCVKDQAVYESCQAPVTTTTTTTAISACFCTKVYAPVVCGNGKTYDNACEATCDSAVACALANV
jgi:hypothetical protein